MKHKIWLLTWDDGSDAMAFANLEDARDYALKQIRQIIREDEKEELQLALDELNENYDVYKGFYIDGWFWCNPIVFCE